VFAGFWFVCVAGAYCTEDLPDETGAVAVTIASPGCRTVHRPRWWDFSDAAEPQVSDCFVWHGTAHGAQQVLQVPLVVALYLLV
jgi:hypothetical protein